MTLHSERLGMGMFRFLLHGSFWVGFTAAAIGMIGMGVLTHPEPKATIWASSGMVCLVMLALGVLFHPHLPPYRWH